ncbi:bis(5'-adenosyl)-triphosphatase enpp4-like [Onthophagus taurus]|uniref:bis(5'-adenosyl)-triphosphatase enpp4-like n=1 Tax=Onthophagus taurus TaxID=166361 RepID=UPI000C205A44|nr:bis(5'-adenosyl)-triphosphatase enpp4-like [Onthophagus taurus]
MLLNIFLQCVFIQFAYTYSNKPILLIVSYDGFRYDYINKASTPTLVKLQREGTYADYMYNVFPTKTFPNHFTISTGMYAEEHGVMGNNFYDPETRKKIGMEKSMFMQNDKAIPIWTLNEMSESNRYSGCMMWPGCKFSYQNVTPTHFESWDPKYDLYKRVDTAISWIMDPQYPANLVMLYIEEPDFHGHVYSPDSTVVENMIKKLDNVTQYLHDKLRKHHLSHLVNVIHLGDHGMISIKYKNILNVSNYLEKNTYSFADSSPTLHVIPEEGYTDDVYNRLKKASAELGHFTVYKKSEIPNRWHFRRNIRTPPILLLADKGYAFDDFIDTVAYYTKLYNLKVGPNSLFGMHGYAVDIKEMYSFFIARGPKIRKNHKINPFNTVDLYSVFANILELQSRRPINTNLIKEVVDKKETSHAVKVIVITVVGMSLSLLLISCAAAITIILIRRQQNMTTAAALNKRFPKSFQQAVEAQHLLEAEEA